MTTIVTRAGKGSPLTHTEVDTNFTNLNTNKLETAAIPLGTAAAPSVSFLSDANTGIYSPGADQVAVATNGTGRLFVDASGRVGIGTSSQEQRLTVLDNSTSVASGSTLTVNGGTFNTGGEGGSIAFSNTVKTGITHAARIRSGLVFLDVQETGNLIFDTNGGAGLTERLRITSAGLVGIGTSSPGNKLAVIGSTGALADSSIRVNGTAGTSSANSGLWLSGNQSTSHYNWLVGSQYNVNAALEITPSTAIDGSTFSTPTAVFTQTGRVGIGTTSPAYALDVASSVAQVGNSTDAFIQYKSTAGNWHVGANSSNAYVFYSGTYGSGNERARIDASGRLLVGTSSKSATASTTAKGVIGVGGGGSFICAEGQVVNGGTIDITVSTGGFHYFTGLLQVNNINASSGGTKTQSLISVLGDTQNGTITTSTLHTANGGAGQSFTITYVATGILRFTNTSGSTCNVHINYMGGGINAS